MQLWARLHAPLDGDGASRLEAHHLAIVHQEPRLLVVRCAAPCLKCVLAVAHAPSGRGGAEAVRAMSQFWHHLSGTLARVACGDHVILMMDANA